MFKTEIIPAIDIIGGKCVRLVQGDFSQKTVYNENPLEVARMFEDNGLRRLHLVDLDGAKAGQIVNYKILETLAVKTNLVIDFGGGLKTDTDLKIAFESGADMVTGGSIAVKDPETFISWLEKYGPGKIILGADTKNGKIAVSGWQEESEQEIFPFIENYMAKGISKVISTDVSKDGMMEGPSFELYGELQKRYPDLFLIASGGVSKLEDIHKLAEMKIPGVITGKAIYEGKISLKEIEKYISG